MKRLLSCLLIASLAVIVGCGGDKTTREAPKKGEAQVTRTAGIYNANEEAFFNAAGEQSLDVAALDNLDISELDADQLASIDLERLEGDDASIEQLNREIEELVALWGDEDDAKPGEEELSLASAGSQELAHELEATDVSVA
jgi:hypothetical protein